MSIKSSIGWCDITCNPIKGLCQGGCWYCYYSGKRGIARRFKQDPELRLDLSVFDKLPKAPKRVFLCSTNDYWGGWIPNEWREAIRTKTQEYPQHTFQVLTKQYENLIKESPYPDNWWIGATVTTKAQLYPAIWKLSDIRCNKRFLSFEPLLEPVLEQILPAEWDDAIDWVIIGRLTGYGHKYDPEIEWIEEIIRACDKAGISVFLKNNLWDLLYTNAFDNDIFWANEKAKMRVLSLGFAYTQINHAVNVQNDSIIITHANKEIPGN